MLKNNRFTCFLYLGLLLLAVTSATAQTGGCGRLYVDSAVTTSGNGSSWATAFKTVTQALGSANTGSCSSREIWVRKGTYFPMQSLSAIAGSRDSSFRILRNGIKLYGGFAGTETTLSARNVAANPTVLSGDIGVSGDTTDNSYHVVTVVSNNAIDSNTRIDGFGIKEGNARGTGTFAIGSKLLARSVSGGLYNSFASPAVANCTFYLNTGIAGGGLYNESSSPLITNCTFSSNTGTNAGGGMYNNNSSPAVTNCTFLSNRAGENGGGGIYNILGSPSINNCTFSSNTTNAGGGGIANSSSSNSVSNCTFSSNTASSGGGVYNAYSLSSITRCTFSSNIAQNPNASEGGGGVFNNQGTATITGCTFSSNNTNGRGGGLYNYGTSGSCSIINCIFSSNTSSNNGGGIWTGISPIAITNCTFSLNASDYGGGIYNNSISLAATNSTFYSNNASYQGGGIYNNATVPTITNCILWANTALSGPSGGGADIYEQGGLNSIINFSTSQTALTGTGNSTANPLFLNTTNLIGPDGVWRTSDDGLQLQAGSPAVNAGSNAAIPAGITTDIIDSIRIRQGIVDQGAYESVPFSCSSGGVVYVDSSKTTTGNGTSWANAYKSLSEGLQVANSCATVTQVWVAKGTYFPMQSAAAIAGSRDSSFRMLRNGIKLYGGFAGTETTLSARNVALNPTVLSGDIGVIGDSTDNSYHVVTVVSNSTIDTNTRIDGFTISKGNANASGTLPPFLVAGKSIYRYAGGGIHNQSSSPFITNCTFSYSSGNQGSGLHNQFSSPFITNCTFSFNNSVSGGGMYNQSSSPSITNCTFSFNNSRGMFNIFSSFPSIINCTFSFNSFGGMFNSSSSPSIRNCIFSFNSGSEGGGMFNSSSSPSIINCIFYSNSANNITGNAGGGGMWNIISSSPSLINCTFSSNSSSTNGGAMANNNSSPSLVNCILWGNTSSSGGSIYNSSGTSNPVVSYSTTDNVQPGIGNSTANPLFINAASPAGPDGIWGTTDDGLRLTTCSGAINTGSNASIPADITADITGAARIQNTTVDRGAYEMPYNAVGVSVTTVSMGPANPVCSNTSVTFTATTTVPGSLPAYQWYKNGVAVGPNQITYTFGSWNSNDSVWVVHTNNDCNLVDTSAKRFIQLRPVPAQPGAIAGNASPCPGTQTYSVAAVTGATTYGWTVPAGWVITAGQGTTSITVTSTPASGNVSVTANNSCATPSAVRALAVTSFTTPVLPTGPTAVCASSTGNVYSVPAVLGATSYTWVVPAGWVITAGQGTTSITVTAAAGITSGNVSVQASNVCPTSGGAPLAVTGGTVMPALIVGSNSGDTVCAGTLVVFTATPINGGAAPSFQWKKNGVNVGTNSPLYSTTALATGDVVTVTFTSNSSCATVPTITAAGPPIVVVPFVTSGVSINGAAGIVLCAGSSYTFTSGSTAGGSAPKYQWYKNGVAIPGATIATYTGANFTSNDAISVRLTSNATCRTSDTVRSNSVTVTVIPNVVPAVTVTANPGTSVPAGSAIAFTANVTAGANNATYQWYKNGVAITGATSSTYTSNTLQGGDLIWVQVAALGPCATPNNLTSATLRISRPAGIQTVSGGGNWQESLSLHPNPNTGRFIVSADWGTISAGERVWVEVVNGLGQWVFKKEVVLTAGKWDLEVQLNEGVTNGLYMLRVMREKDGSSTAKSVLIQR